MNQWIWLIRDKNPLLFLILILFTFTLFLNLQKRSKITFVFSILLFLIMLALYSSSTHKTLLWELNSVEQDTQLARLNYYKSSSLPFLPEGISQKVPYWLEKKEITLVLYKLQRNVANVFDLNYYFFGSFPREMQVPGEFPKFSPLFLPFFFIGVVNIFTKKKLFFLLSLLLTIAFVSVIGDRNHLGIFVSFPFLVLFIQSGIQTSLLYLKSKLIQ